MRCVIHTETISQSFELENFQAVDGHSYELVGTWVTTDSDYHYAPSAGCVVPRSTQHSIRDVSVWRWTQISNGWQSVKLSDEEAKSLVDANRETLTTTVVEDWYSRQG